MVWDVLATLALFVLTLVPPVFVYHKVYQDGVFGRVGLLLISIFAGCMFLEQVLGDGYEFPKLLVGLLVAAALFICWHLFRFHTRVVSKRGPTPCGLQDQIGCPYVGSARANAAPTGTHALTGRAREQLG